MPKNTQRVCTLVLSLLWFLSFAFVTSTCFIMYAAVRIITEGFTRDKTISMSMYNQGRYIISCLGEIEAGRATP